MIGMTTMYVKVYKRKRDNTFNANVVKHPHKKGKAIAIAKVHVNV
jgi:hypothetical protein